ncbi:hypothetical protein AALP_AAs58461U000200 [Arabis alpina]|uniref:Uncharacterized protein n=1 Tax=Arabis alpina TaxID=50452 RepID=A0A087G1U9_ARAAL|nr:hypothetical protein AALP_AAs58461U000200 [Arabis alpina]
MSLTLDGSVFATASIKGILIRIFNSLTREIYSIAISMNLKWVAASSFGPGKTVLVVGIDGSFRRCRFDDGQGGDMVELEHKHFVSLPETDGTIVEM